MRMVLRKALAQRGQKILTLGLGRKEEKPAPGAAGSAPASGWSPGATRWQPPTTHVFPARFGGGGGGPPFRETSRAGGKLRRVPLSSQWSHSSRFANTLPLVGTWSSEHPTIGCGVLVCASI